MAHDPESLPDLFPIYYKKLFPYGPYYRWLNYGGVPKTYFTHREFSFTLKDDIYIRYLSFSDQQDFERELQKRCPYKIDIGAVFSHRPKEHKTVKATAFQAEEKELVFDIDMTDYDDVRNCCSGADICPKCWPLMVIAVKIIHRALTEDFGYEHLLWVYSGRRGIHCWVCDEGARKLSANARSAIAEYLTVVKGGESQLKKVTLNGTNVHPSIQAALKVIDEHFESYAIHKQDFLSTDEQLKKILALIPDDSVCKTITDFLGKHEKGKVNSGSRWSAICELLQNHRAEAKKFGRPLDEIKLQYCYPRLDVNVSKGINHLLKSPFCIHPKTGRVCVPMDPAEIDTFDPFTVPTIGQLCDELNEKVVDDDTSKKRVKDYKQTSLKPSLRVFDNFLSGLEKSRQGRLILESDKSGDF